MKVYQYDVAGLYIGEEFADPSPLEPGKYLIPARCTQVAPPAEIPADKAARWNGASWVIVNAPTVAQADDPVEKLRTFLTENPDVADLLATTDEVQQE